MDISRLNVGAHIHTSSAPPAGDGFPVASTTATGDHVGDHVLGDVLGDTFLHDAVWLGGAGLVLAALAIVIIVAFRNGDIRDGD